MEMDTILLDQLLRNGIYENAKEISSYSKKDYARYTKKALKVGLLENEKDFLEHYIKTVDFKNRELKKVKLLYIFVINKKLRSKIKSKKLRDLFKKIGKSLQNNII